MSQLTVRSEIAASVWKILVDVDDVVAEDDTLVILESMKMEIPLAAPCAGRVKSVNVAEGQTINAEDVACVLELDSNDRFDR